MPHWSIVAVVIGRLVWRELLWPGVIIALVQVAFVVVDDETAANRHSVLSLTLGKPVDSQDLFQRLKFWITSHECSRGVLS